MSNLSDLLPAGAAAKQLTFTDSGSGISSKAPVVLNSDGTVSGISGSAESIGSTSNPLANESTYVDFGPMSRDIIYDPTADRVIAAINARISGGDNRVLIVAGEVGASSITWGTPLALSGTGVGNAEKNCNLCYDEDNGFPLLLFQSYDSSYLYYPTVVAIVVSGSTISLGTPLVLQSAASTNTGGALVYDTTNDKVVALYGIQGVGNNYQWGAVITVSSTSSLSVTGGPTQNNPQAINSMNTAMAFDSSSGLCAIVNQLGTADHFFAQTIDASTGSPVFNTITTIYTNASGGGHVDVCYDSNKQACIGTSYTTGDWSNYQNVVVPFTTSGSGASATVSAGTPAFTGTSAVINYYACCTFDSTNNLTVIPFEYTSGDLYYVTCTLSGSSPYTATLTDPSLLATYSAGNSLQPFCCYDPDQNKTVVIYGTNDQVGSSVAFAPASTNLTAQAFVGIADSAISASAAGSVIVQGGTVTGPTAEVTIAESLSSAFLYAQDAPADAVIAMASATGSSNLLIAYYVNDGVTQGARVQAATISSGSISYGSSDVIGAASSDVYYYAIANTSSNNKFVVFWQDQSDSYIYGAVVTLTGSSISYGATTAVYSSAAINNYDTFNAAYDPDTDRVILGVCDNSDTYAYSVVIEIGSTTIDTVGTPAKIDSSSAANGYAKKIDLCYDTTADKVIATYVNVGGGGSYYLRVAAGTVTGGATNSISWGSSSVVYSGDATYPRCAYNATDQRVVIVYKQAADAKGYSSVATVSGTTVTANTPSVFYDPSSTGGWVLYYTSVAHDSYMNKMVIYMRASAGDAVYGAIDTGTNSIAWSSVYNVSADAYNPPQTEFDVGTNQVILLGAGTSKATAESYIYTVPGTVSGQPLTVGTKYYVTTSGTFSSSADTPSVNAGLAISTTSLLLNGDS